MTPSRNVSLIQMLLYLASETDVFISYACLNPNTPLTALKVQQLIFLLSRTALSEGTSVVFTRTANTEHAPNFLLHSA